jgi:hypothetical protein
MHVHEIARSEWQQTLDAISVAHHGDRVSVEIRSPRAGAQPAVWLLPLSGLSYDRHNGRSAVAITMSRGGRRHLTEIVDNLARVFVVGEDARAGSRLELLSRDGTITVVDFSH